MDTKPRSAKRAPGVLGPPPADGGPKAPTGSVFTFTPGVPSGDPVETRHAMRRLRESSNRLSRPDRLLVLDCQGRGCRRKLGQVLTHPERGGATPDGTIEPNFFTEGPVLMIWGPFASEPSTAVREYTLRGTKASMTAPLHTLTLRGHRVREDGSIDPAELPLGPGHSVVIVCGCGHRNVVSMSALSEQVELVRSALDAQ